MRSCPPLFMLGVVRHPQHDPSHHTVIWYSLISGRHIVRQTAPVVPPFFYFQRKEGGHHQTTPRGVKSVTLFALPSIAHSSLPSSHAHALHSFAIATSFRAQAWLSSVSPYFAVRSAPSAALLFDYFPPLSLWVGLLYPRVYIIIYHLKMAHNDKTQRSITLRSHTPHPYHVRFGTHPQSIRYPLRSQQLYPLASRRRYNPHHTPHLYATLRCARMHSLWSWKPLPQSMHFSLNRIF